MKLTQVEKIRRALNRGETLTMLSGLRFGTLNLHRRLDECGVKTVKGWRTVRGRKLRTWRAA